MVDEKIEILDHTADLAIRIRADNDRHLFELGAQGVYQAIGKVVAEGVNPEEYVLELKAGSQEDLFHDWLAEILYYVQVQRIIFDRYNFESLSSTYLKVIAEGRSIDMNRTEFEAEIKAVTYHHLRIEHTPEGLNATVIFDI
jgi:SHS2 domain-containing protein